MSAAILGPDDVKKPKTTDDLLNIAFVNEVNKEIKPLLWEINERINRLDSQDREDQEPKRDMYGKSAYDYTMLKYKLTLGDLRDKPIEQLRELRKLFTGLGPSVIDQKEHAERFEKVKQDSNKAQAKEENKQANSVK